MFLQPWQIQTSLNNPLFSLLLSPAGWVLSAKAALEMMGPRELNFCQPGSSPASSCPQLIINMDFWTSCKHEIKINYYVTLWDLSFITSIVTLINITPLLIIQNLFWDPLPLVCTILYFKTHLYGKLVFSC